MKIIPKVYIGDSVYAEIELRKERLKLYTDNGDGPKNIIYLEPFVWKALQRFVSEYKGEEADRG